MKNIRPAAVAAVLLLAACDTREAPAPPEDEQSLILSCDAFALASADALAAAYGPENLTEQSLAGSEGQSYVATVLYPNDPARRLEIVWRDPAARAQPASISVTGETTAWSGPNGLRIGQALADVERANGRTFAMWGFGWDYGGWVSDWRGGAFAPEQGCMPRVRFEPTGEIDAAIGDTEFESDSDAVRRAAPRVSEFGLRFDS